MKYNHSIWTAVKDNILRAGLSNEIYQSVKPLILAENTRIMKRLGAIGLLFGCIMTVLSIGGLVSRHVLPAYLTLLGVSVLFFALQKSDRVKNGRSGLLLPYLQMSAFLIYGVMNSAVFAPDPSTMGVTIIVLITLVPFLVIDVPWREYILIICTSAAYLAGIYLYKDPSIRTIETTNTISFTFVSLLSASVFTPRTIHSMADRLYIERERDTDGLTGLSSRHAGELLTRARLQQSLRGVFIMIDVDDFKSANDRYGHLFGDRVLQLVGSAISASIRRKDIATRFGGDEFCILLDDCEMKDAQQVVQRIQQFLKESQKDSSMQITCSFGLASVIPFEDPNDLLNRADQALYQAKKDGKNQVRLNHQK